MQIEEELSSGGRGSRPVDSVIGSTQALEDFELMSRGALVRVT